MVATDEGADDGRMRRTLKPRSRPAQAGTSSSGLAPRTGGVLGVMVATSRTDRFITLALVVANAAIWSYGTALAGLTV